MVALGIAKSARVTKRNSVDCRLVISDCSSDPMMKSYISKALFMSFSRSSSERERDPVELHVEEIDRDRIFDIGGVEQTQLAVERLTRGEELQAPEFVDQLMLAIDDDDRAFAAHGALQILGDEILQRIGLARAAAGDDPMMRRADGLRNFRAKRCCRMPANGVPARKGEGSSRWCGSASFGGLLYLPRATPEMR